MMILQTVKIMTVYALNRKNDFFKVFKHIFIYNEDENIYF